MRPWLASCILYFFIWLVCSILRFLIHSIAQNEKMKLRIFGITVEFLALQFVGIIQICAPMFDVNFVMEHYGILGVFLEISLVEILNGLSLIDNFVEPCSQIGICLKSRHWAVLLIILTVQLTAAYTSYLLVLIFWHCNLHPDYTNFLQNNCEPDLTVTTAYGIAIEAGGFSILRITEFLLEKYLNDSNILLLLNAHMSGLVTIIGIPFTGMYASPIVAWACTFNCGQIAHFVHFAVYWFAPLTAWMMLDCFLPNESIKLIL